LTESYFISGTRWHRYNRSRCQVWRIHGVRWPEIFHHEVYVGTSQVSLGC